MNYLIARAIIDGKIGLHIFSDEAVRDKQVLQLGERVQMQLDPSLNASGAGGRPCRVTIRLKNGQTYTRTAEHAKGSLEVPMTEAELRAKFLECAREAVSESTAGKTLESVQHLETLPDIRPMCQLLIG